MATGEVTEVLWNLRVKRLPGATIPERWWTEPGWLDRILEILASHDLWPSFDTIANLDGEPPVPCGSFAALLAATRTWKPGIHELRSSRPGRGSHVTLDLERAAFGMHLWFTDADLDGRRDGLTRAVARAGLDLLAALRPGFGLDGISACHAVDFVYPRVRPPIHYAGWPLGAIVAIVDLRQERQNTAVGQSTPEFVELYERVSRSALPPGAEVTFADDAYAIRWVDSLRDRDHVRARLGAHDAWAAATLPVSRDPDWNALGDRRVAGHLAPRPPFTLYDAVQQLACVAIGAHADGWVDAADAQALAAIRRQPPAPIARLVAIVHRRDVALALFPRLRQLGLDGVVYPDEAGRLWDPFPPGLWKAP